MRGRNHQFLRQQTEAFCLANRRCEGSRVSQLLSSDDDIAAYPQAVVLPRQHRRKTTWPAPRTFSLTPKNTGVCSVLTSQNTTLSRECSGRKIVVWRQQWRSGRPCPLATDISRAGLRDQLLNLANTDGNGAAATFLPVIKTETAPV